MKKVALIVLTLLLAGSVFGTADDIGLTGYHAHSSASAQV